jgi:hypothetical protein
MQTTTRILVVGGEKPGHKHQNRDFAILVLSQPSLSTLTTAPTTRRTSRITPPPASTERLEANTVKKSRFYSTYNKEISFKSQRAIACNKKTTESTARR